jgi:hypothetical protein
MRPGLPVRTESVNLMASDQVIAEYARMLVLDEGRRLSAERAEIARLEAEGYLIVTHEDDDRDPEGDDHHPARIVCWRTRERLGRFDGGGETWAAAERAAGREFWHIDRVADIWDYSLPVPPEGFPPGLAEGVAQWVLADGNADEVASFTGMDADEIRRSVESLTPENTPPVGS